MSAARTYPVAAAVAARRYRDAGWTLARTAELVADEVGCPTPSENSVLRWTDPQWAERDRRKTAERARVRVGARTRLGRDHFSLEFRMARVQALDELGVSPATIATVMTFDFGVPVSEGQIRYALKTGRYPKRVSKVAA